MTIMAQTIARLEDTKATTGLKLVAGAAEFSALQGPPPRNQQPAGYVLPTVDRAGRNELIGDYRQRVSRGFAVVLALGNLGDARGEKASIAMAAVEDLVARQLAGWRPDNAVDLMQFTGARTLGLKDQVLWRQLDFNVHTRLKP